MKIVAIIPARLASSRLPNKVLLDIKGLPMVEHVRRRALLSDKLSEVYVATCDTEIKDVIESYGGKVIMTGHHHINGTSRATEAISNLNCSNIILLQGDEPLLDPTYIDQFINEINSAEDSVVAWNAVSNLESEEELDKYSFVKCLINHKGRIVSCFRKSPCFTSFENQKVFIKKMLGLLAFKKEFLLKLYNYPTSFIEMYESIEQMRIIENGFHLQSLLVKESLPSINEPNEINLVLEYLDNNSHQKELLNRILNL